MINWSAIITYLVVGAILMLILVELLLATIVPSLKYWRRKLLIALDAILLLCMVVSIIDLIVYMNPKMVGVERIVFYLEYLLFSLLCPLMVASWLHCCEENWRHSRLFRAVLALWCFFFILLGIAQFTTCFYYITPENRFCLGPLYPFLQAPLVVIMIITLAGVIQNRTKLLRKYYRAFIFFNVIGIVGIILQGIFATILISDFIIAICSLLVFILILTDQIEQYMQKQRKIAHQRASVMVLQMRPHFIYNTMTSIYYLCKLNPQKAQQVTLDFTNYLRKNFTAIVSEDLIHFSEELEHTRAYLAVEQAQFDDRLFVEYDTPHTQFRMPPLTLQPIVENAVKHGMDPDSEPLCISIRTRKTNSGSEIIVEDNGSGFSPSDVSGTHSALFNIRQRLEIMCGGHITFASGEKCGTVVTVMIPQK